MVSKQVKQGRKETGRRIEYMPITDLRGAKTNPKDHDFGAINQSINRFGYVEAIALDERTQRLIAGHGRLESLRGMKKDGAVPPPGVQAKNGEWLIPVQRGWASRDDAEAKAYLIASNRLVELGGWDDAARDAMLAELAKLGEGALLGTGYDADDVDKILREMGGATGEDDSVQPIKDPWVKTGDLIALGEHKILCGDCTNEADVARLLGGDKPNIMVTDPPYGVEYDPGWRNEASGKGQIAGGSRRVGKAENDDRFDWSAAWAHFKGNIAYVWHAGLFSGEVAKSLEGFEIRSQIIWRKPMAPITRGHYRWQHEPCWYAVRKGGTATWEGDHSQTTVWEAAAPGTGGDEAGETAHSTQKPVELYRIPLMNHTKRGDLLFEPFSGSGTAIVACERTGRRARAIEISPAYVQAAVERWERLTGGKHEVLK